MAKRNTSRKSSARTEQNDAPSKSRFTTDELPNIPEPGDVADQAARSESMSSEPSQEDIRLRAYHRYLDRGGKDGADFEDWIAAEHELKHRKANF
ncbi:MAG TPA: DUF2934 domain-containing protein [Vicinamibacterales bacterium]|jgi:hypothetical protein